jgi:hypothetical protein
MSAKEGVHDYDQSDMPVMTLVKVWGRFAWFAWRSSKGQGENRATCLQLALG